MSEFSARPCGARFVLIFYLAVETAGLFRSCCATFTETGVRGGVGGRGSSGSRRRRWCRRKEMAAFGDSTWPSQKTTLASSIITTSFLFHQQVIWLRNYVLLADANFFFDCYGRAVRRLHNFSIIEFVVFSKSPKQLFHFCPADSWILIIFPITTRRTFLFGFKIQSSAFVSKKGPNRKAVTNQFS